MQKFGHLTVRIHWLKDFIQNKFIERKKDQREKKWNEWMNGSRFLVTQNDGNFLC